MIYCIGKTVIYDAKLATGQPLWKLGKGVRRGVYREGGSVWQTEAEARAFIEKNGLQGTRSVYGVLADWDLDTDRPKGEPFRRLVNHHQIVQLDGVTADQAVLAEADRRAAGETSSV